MNIIEGMYIHIKNETFANNLFKELNKFKDNKYFLYYGN